VARRSIQFVLRLSPEVHRRIAALPKGIIEGGDFDGLRAYSTYLQRGGRVPQRGK
jgi:hypothetical protein